MLDPESESPEAFGKFLVVIAFVIAVRVLGPGVRRPLRARLAALGRPGGG